MGRLIDLTGKKFGRWTVIRKMGVTKFRNVRWLCKCDCGVEKEVSSESLLKGKSRSCGCLKKEISTKINLIDLIGKRFGRWVVIKRAPTKNRVTFWLCKCDCGNEKEVSGNSLRKGDSISCGCYKKELTSTRVKLENGLASKNSTFNNYKLLAKKSNRLFELSFEEFLDLTQQSCHYCGSKPNNIKKSQYNSGDFIYSGIDRMDNTKGYTIKNCVPCCETCNKAKRNLTYTEYISWIKKSYEYMGLGE